MVVALHQYGSIVLGQSVSALPFGMAPFFETLSNRNPVYVVRKRTRNMAYFSVKEGKRAALFVGEANRLPSTPYDQLHAAYRKIPDFRVLRT